MGKHTCPSDYFLGYRLHVYEAHILVPNIQYCIFAAALLTVVEGGALDKVVLPLVHRELAGQPRHPEGRVGVHAHVALRVHGGSDHGFALAHHGQCALAKVDRENKQENKGGFVNGWVYTSKGLGSKIPHPKALDRTESEHRRYVPQ